jgi:hypothetical protein
VKIRSVEDVDIYLIHVFAEVTLQDMANHPIFSTQALPNSLRSPFSYLKSKIQNKQWTNYIIMDIIEVVD